jgi:hypothetical protein
MVDRQARDALANALAGFLSRRILSNAFDCVVSHYAWDKGTLDASVAAISVGLSTLYSAFRNEPLLVSEETRLALLRTLAFLRSDLDYTHAPREFPEKWEEVCEFWPFADLREWQANRHLQPESLSEYDVGALRLGMKASSLAVATVIGILLLFLLVFGGALIALSR